MKVVLYYPVLAGGGCEKRLAELGSYLLRQGDDVWIVAAALQGDIPVSIMCGQGGFPLQRILLAPSGTALQEFLLRVCRERQIDLIDVQWPDPLPEQVPCSMVYTTHGLTQPLPEGRDFAALISVDDLPVGAPHHGFAPYVQTVWNWVNLSRFPFTEMLGRGAVFFGRSFKLWPNAVTVARLCNEPIDAYGFLAGGWETMPPQLRWLGYVDVADRLYDYRIVFASAQAALEALAAGRLVICGHDQGGYIADARLVMPQDLPALSGRQLWFSDRPWSAEALLAEYQKAKDGDFDMERWTIRCYIEEHHNLEIQCGKIRAVYQECLP